ncbi:MAG TPA: EamA family transporter [Selenomonadales bacterium]|nr:EamA family transporter [Selenomonadales bacterium]
MVFFYAFLAVLCLGLAPFFGKSLLNNVNPVTAFAVRTVIAASIMVVWLILSNSLGEILNLSPAFWGIVSLEALLAAVLGDLAYFYALQRGNVQEVAIVMSCAPIITLVVGYVLFEEIVSLRHVMAGILITTGLILLSYNH